MEGLCYPALHRVTLFADPFFTLKKYKKTPPIKFDGVKFAIFG